MGLLSTIFNLNIENGRVRNNHVQTWGEDANWLNMTTAMASDIVAIYGMIITPTTPAIYSTQDSTPTTGGTVISNGHTELALNPAGTLASLTVQFPSAPVNGQLFNINTTQQITALTFTGGNIQFYSGSFHAAEGVMRFIYNTSQGQWLVN